ncbi:hypothetical protein G5V59_27405 [Nocardioides sp. W3-2-3]|nr:hypothetical protein [Nocardioides convexus]
MVQRHQRAAEQRRAIAKARKAADVEGVPLVEDPTAEWGSGASGAVRHRVYGNDEIEAARAAGNLRAQPTPHGIDYYRLRPGSRRTRTKCR